MSNYAELDLGTEGLQFVMSELAGGRTFSKCLLERVDLQAGEVVTHLPQGVSLKDAKRFQFGGKLPTPPQSEWMRSEGAVLIPIPTTRPHLVALIGKHLSTPESVCILENAIASRDDPYLEQIEEGVSFFGSEVYHLLVGPSSAPAIDAAVKEAQAIFTFVGALSSLAGGVLPSLRDPELGLGIMQTLAERTGQIFCGAYDGEGYVIWRRSVRHPGTQQHEQI